MANIFFSLSGEGRGHATRIRAVVEALRHEHRITIFAPGDAFGFLAPLYAGSEVRVRRLAGLRFHYAADRKLNYRKTVSKAGSYLRRLPSLLAMLEHIIREERPDLVVTDFEPALPRAASRCGVPFVSLSHQHFLLTYDLGSLPLTLQFHALYMSMVVRAYYSGQRETIVSSFYFPPLRRGCRQVTQAGVLLRPEVHAAEVEHGSHLVAYCRRFAGDHVLRALGECGREVRIYGLGSRPTQGRLVFREIDERRFVHDLATCDALVATAGNQLVGEALFFGKPALVMPEAGNHEQRINAHFLQQSGAGQSTDFERLTAKDLRAFLGRIDEYRARIDRRRMDGLPDAMAVLRRNLPSTRPAPNAVALPVAAVVPTPGNPLLEAAS